MKMTRLSLVGAMLALGLAGCSEEVQTVVKEEPKLVKAMVLEADDHARFRQFPATVEASEDATLAFRVSGELQSLLVVPGQDVEKDALLAKLDPTDYQIALDQAQANFDLAKSQFDRSEKLLERQLSSQADYDSAKAQLKVTQAALNSAKANLAYTELHAPFSGQVAQKFVENFENITAQQAIVSLQKNSVVDIAIQIPEDFLSNLDRNTQYQPEVTFEANRNFTYRATLKEFDTEADSATNTFKVVFSLPRPKDFNVLPGMSATVKVELDKVMKTKQDGWLVPAAAVFTQTVNGEEQSFVWVIDSNNQVKQTQVRIGAISDKGFKVIGGLAYGDTVVAAGVHRLQAGEPVRIWHKERGL